MGNDYIGGWEDYYNGPDGNLAVYSEFYYSHNLMQLQRYSVSGSIRRYNSQTDEYYNVEFHELDLSADESRVVNSLRFDLFHFHVD